MEGGRRQEETFFKEFEQLMEHTKTTHETQVKGLKVEQVNKKKSETYKVPLYGNLKPCKKAEEIVRLISININCMSFLR